MTNESELAANARSEQRRLIVEGLSYPEGVASDAARHAVDFVWLETFPLPILKGEHRRQVAQNLANIARAIRDGVSSRK